MTGNYYCDFCIKIMEWWSRNTPLSYGAINILLFVIIQPLLICFFFTTTVIMLRLKKEKTRKLLRNVSVIIFLCFLVCGILSVAIPFSDVAAEMGAASTYSK